MCDDLLMMSQTFLHASYRPNPSKNQRRNQKILKPESLIENKKAILLIGSDLTGDYLLALDTLIEYYDIFYFLGKAGLLVYMYFGKIEKAGDVVLDASRRALLGKILETCKNLGKRVEFPIKFDLVEKVIFD